MNFDELKTPFFIAYPQRIVNNYRLMCDTLPVDRLYYASKANGEAGHSQSLL